MNNKLYKKLKDWLKDAEPNEEVVVLYTGPEVDMVIETNGADLRDAANRLQAHINESEKYES